MKAYARLDRDGEYPNASIDITDEEWETLYFEDYHTLDGDNKLDFPEECYNMMLVHPTTSKVFWGYSADFDFGERPAKPLIDPFKIKVTFNLTLSVIDELDKTWISLRRKLKDKGRITKTLIVERAIELAIKELETKGESSALFRGLVKD